MAEPRFRFWPADSKVIAFSAFPHDIHTTYWSPRTNTASPLLAIFDFIFQSCVHLDMFILPHIFFMVPLGSYCSAVFNQATAFLNQSTH